MVEDMQIKEHLGKFNRNLLDLKMLKSLLDNEDQTMFFVAFFVWVL